MLNERKERRRRLVEWLKSSEIEAAVFLKEEIELNAYNFVYYGGDMAAEEYAAIILDTSGNCFAIVQEHRYDLVKSSGEFAKVLSTRQSSDELLANVKSLTEDKYRAGAICIDSSTLTSNAARKLEQSGIMLDSDLTEFVYHERSKKSDYEIREIEKAVKIGRNALEKTVNSLKVGQRTNDITLVLKKSLLEEGAVSESFATDVRIREGVSETDIVRLKRGSLILFDFGARLPSQYLSDMGRTIPFGMNACLRDFLSDVCEIKRLGLKEIRNGKTGFDVRAEIDRLIKEYGYVSVHRPGHQIGLNVHEPYEPNLAYGEENRKPLEGRNLVTWEPGIGAQDPALNPVRFGLAHMEDIVLVKENSKMLGNIPLEFW